VLAKLVALHEGEEIAGEVQQLRRGSDQAGVSLAL
jgi:hypothetical protein